jgi:hypothetical protein
MILRDLPRRFGRLSSLAVAMVCVVPLGLVAIERGAGWRDALLGWHRARGVQALAAKLHDPNPFERSYAVDGLILAGSAAEPKLVAAATDVDVEVRLLAIPALGRLSPSPTTANKALKLAMRDSDVRVRRVTAEVMSKFESELEAGGRAELYRALDDEDEEVRFQAARSLVWLEPGPVEPAVVVLLELVGGPGDAASFGRPAVADVLMRAGPKAERRTISVLIPLVSDGDLMTRRSAAECLERIGPPAKAAVPALENALKDDDRLMRCLATLALHRIEGEGRTLGPIEALDGWADMPPAVSARLGWLLASGSSMPSNQKLMHRGVVDGYRSGGRGPGGPRFKPRGDEQPPMPDARP